MKKDDNLELLHRIREEYQRDVDADHENRIALANDLKFLAGEQWPEEVKVERDGRPMLTINRLPQFVKQVTGEMRQNKPAITVLPKDGQADKDIAEVYSAIVRHIETGSDADRVYVKAAEQAVRCGIGHFRVLTEWQDEGFDQEIVIKSIRNPLSVVWDLSAQAQDKSDATHCFVTEMMKLDKFKKMYPDADVSSFDSRSETWIPYWKEGDSIRLAEYWCKEDAKKKIALMQDGAIVDITTAKPEDVAQLPIQAIRTVNTQKVKWYRATGAAIIDSGDWAGCHIPIIPVVGEEIEIGDKIVRHGLVRFAKDAQTSYNYWRSAAVEHIALAPKAPFIATAKQIAPYKALWDKANQKPLPYLLYDPDPQAPGAPARQAPPMIPGAMYQEAEVADNDMKATTGIYDASLGQRSNETSGKAINARQSEGDTSTFVYIDNQKAAIERCGKILVDLIPKIYTNERVIRIVGEDGSIEGWAAINKQLPDGTSINDISVGSYDVQVSTGPAYATRRQQAADSMMQFVQAVPAAGQVAADLIAKNMDWPGADKIAERLAKMLPPGMDENAQPTAPPPPNPMEMLSIEKAQEDVNAVRLDNAIKELSLAASNGQLQKMVEEQVTLLLSGLAAPPQNQPQTTPSPAPQPAGFFNGDYILDKPNPDSYI